jgi:tetratricopeptide (TPR) repeat protein
MELERWERAAEDYARALELAPGDLSLHYEHALACLSAGQANTYRKVCAGMKERFGKLETPVIPAWLLWTCTLGPGALPEASQLGLWLKKLEEAEANSPQTSSLMARAYYRSGDFQAALKHLEEAERRRGKEEVLDCFFLAMAHHRMGHTETAQRWLDRGKELARSLAEGIAQPNADDSRYRKVAQLLRQEAETLLRGKPGESTTR